jgi:hypothetical protein
LIWRSDRPRVLARATLRGLQMYLEEETNMRLCNFLYEPSD